VNALAYMIALIRDRAQEGLQPRLGTAAAIERREHRLDVLRMSVDRRLHELVLGLEVVVDVAHGHVRRLRDVRERRLLDPLLMEDQARTLDQPLALVGHGSPLPRLEAEPTATVAV